MKKIIGNKKGIQTILAALLMVVIVVVASVMVYAWSTGLLGTLLVTPQTGKEAINSELAVANSTTATLNLRNTGSASISLVTYYVKDSNNNQWALTTWTGPTMAPNALGIAYINIGSTKCPSCVYTGTASAFTTYNTGNSYTVTVITSRNNQFSFTVTR